MNKKVLFASLLTGLLLVSCGQKPDPKPDPKPEDKPITQPEVKPDPQPEEKPQEQVKATSVEVTGYQFVAVGKTTQLTAKVLPENTTDKTVTWTSSDETVATVDANGKVTAVKAGTAKITATTTEATVKAEYEITTAVAPTKIKVNNSYHTNILKDGEFKLDYVVTAEADANKELVFSLEDKTIISFDEATNMVKGLGLGVSNITVSSKYDPTVKGKVIVHVCQAPESVEVYLSDKAQPITTGEGLIGVTSEFKVNYKGPNAFYGCTVTSSDVTVAKVKPKKNSSNIIELTGLKEGTAEITVASVVDPTKTYKFTVNVKPLPPLVVPAEGLTFEFGKNIPADKVDFSKNGGTSFTTTAIDSGNQKFLLEKGSNAYVGVYDAKGQNCLKLGARNDGKVSFTVTDEVKSVVFKVAKYNKDAAKFFVNGTEKPLTSSSNDGLYDEIVVDTTTVKTIDLSTYKRVMIDSITLKK